MKKSKYGHFDKRPAVKALLLQGKGPTEIRKAVGCSYWLINDVKKGLWPRDDSKTIDDDAKQVTYQGEEYVSRSWLASVTGLAEATISKHMKRQAIPFEVFYRQAFHIPARFFLLAKVWEQFPEWEQRYTSRVMTPLGQNGDEQKELRDVSAKQVALLCALIEHWLAYTYWPSASELLAHEALTGQFTNTANVRHHLRILQEKKCLTIKTCPGHKGKAENRYYLIHRAPKRLRSQIVHCPKCGHIHRVLHPFFKQKK